MLYLDDDFAAAAPKSLRYRLLLHDAARLVPYAADSKSAHKPPGNEPANSPQRSPRSDPYNLRDPRHLILENRDDQQRHRRPHHHALLPDPRDTNSIAVTDPDPHKPSRAPDHLIDGLLNDQG